MRSLLQSIMLLLVIATIYLMGLRTLRATFAEIMPNTHFFQTQTTDFETKRSSLVSWLFSKLNEKGSWSVRPPFGAYFIIGLSFLPFIKFKGYFVTTLLLLGLLLLCVQLMIVVLFSFNIRLLYVLDWLSNDVNLLFNLGVGPIFLVYERYLKQLKSAQL